MKKIIISLLLASVFLFAGCSCNALPQLSFNKGGFTGGTSTESSGLTETATYGITFNEQYRSGDDFNFSKYEAIGDKFVTTATGSYVTTLSVIEQSSVTGEATSSNILGDKVTEDDNGAKMPIIKYVTEATVDWTYTAGEDVKTVTDTIKTESYFLRTDMSLAPIYAIKYFDSTKVSLKLENNKAIPTYTQEKAVITTVYNKNNYTIKSYKYDEYVADKTTATVTKTQKHDYTFRTAIDNSALLFAIRNSAIAKDNSISVPVISDAYGISQTLEIKNYLTATEKATIEVDGVSNPELDIPVNRISYAISGQNSGRSQLCYIQNEAKEGVPNRALMVKHIAPIAEYTSYYCLGAMVYTLESTTLN